MPILYAHVHQRLFQPLISQKRGISGQFVRKPIPELIRQDLPGFGETDLLAVSELNEYRRRYLENLLVREMGELTELEETVLSNVHERRALKIGRANELTVRGRCMYENLFIRLRPI